MKFVVLVFVGICVSCIGAISYKVCEADHQKPFFIPDKVDLEPVKPRRGHDAIFTISGRNGHTVRSGDFIIEVYVVATLFGRKSRTRLTTEKHDLCDYTSCPMKPGQATVKYTRHLPSYTPPGTYLVRVKGVDNIKKRLALCVEVEFPISLSYLTT